MKTNTNALITHSAASAGVTGIDGDGYEHKGILLYINISAISGTSPTLTVTLKGKSPVSGAEYTILASAALSAPGLTVMKVYPGLTAAANLAANDILPAIWRVDSVIGGTTPSVTATISATLVK